MFLYTVALFAMFGAADADTLEKAHHFHKVDVKGISKFAKAHRDSANSHRNLRDQIKPHDTVYQFFRDPSCNVAMFEAVDHGNTLYKNVDDEDGSISHIKIGCAVDTAGDLKHEFVDYGMTDGAGAATFQMQVPFFGIEAGIKVGQCIQIPNDDGEDITYAKIDCSGKDIFRDAPGYHILAFEDQLKECHDHSLKTNRAKGHNFIAANKCISMEAGESMMAVEGCSNGEASIRVDPNGETCENLSEVYVVKFNNKCKEKHDDNGNFEGTEREMCVDENTPAQQ